MSHVPRTTPRRTPTRRRPIAAVLVVVPAHDEEERIGACLDSVSRAVDQVARDAPRVSTSVVVVLDRCTDRTAIVVESRPGVSTVEVDDGCVGAARRAGVRSGSARLGHDPAEVLVVNTDADCTVPPSWLVDHLHLAREHDVVLGEVQPSAGEMSAAAMALWLDRNPVGRGSLHGANLGVRLDAYQRVGGFPAVPAHEDLLLVRALRADGVSIAGGTCVTTSARRVGRAPAGFATYLDALDHEMAAHTTVLPEPRLTSGPLDEAG